MRRMEGGRDWGLKDEKTAPCSHARGRVAVLLPLRDGGFLRRAALLPFSFL